jgi:photosystem II stability/assembly factor-like uncharacterized protein
MIALDLPHALRATVDGAATPVTANEARLRAGARSARLHRLPLRSVLPSRMWRPRVMPLAFGAAALSLLAVFLVASPFTGSSSRSARPGAVPPVSHLKMRLIDSTTSPFQLVAGGPQTGNLECVTAVVCYADATSGSAPVGSGVERTADGGATWKPTASLPDGEQLSWPLSCPTALVCFGVASEAGSNPLNNPGPLQLAVTTDGGQGWSIESLPAPAGISNGSVQQLSCATPRACVLDFVGSPAGAGSAAGGGPSAMSGTFLSTTDGGQTWMASSAVAELASTQLWTLRCDPDGSCLALAPTGSVQEPASQAMVALRSTDWGRTWMTTSSPLATGPGILLVSCGDALHCMIAYPSVSGGRIAVATTSDGGATWRVKAAPPSWPSVAVSVSCATPQDCFISAASPTQGGYGDPVIEATHDGGDTWAPLALPIVDGSPLALVYPLSCPATTGCIGVGATPKEFSRPPHPPSGAAPPSRGSIPPTSGRVIVSNL